MTWAYSWLLMFPQNLRVLMGLLGALILWRAIRKVSNSKEKWVWYYLAMVWSFVISGLTEMIIWMVS